MRRWTGCGAGCICTLICRGTMTARSRAASVDFKPDFRSKAVRDMLPDPPDHLSTHQKRQWRTEKWEEIWGGGTIRGLARIPDRPPPLPKARAAASSFGGVLKPKKWISNRVTRLVQQCCLGPVCCVVLICVAAMGGTQGLLAQLANFGGAALMLGESTSIAAGQALNLTGVVASSASEVVTAATTNGLTAAANAWHGVDILGLEAQRCTAMLTLDGKEVLEEWFRQPFAVTMVPCLSDEVRSLLLATLDSISLGMPMTKTGTEVVDLGSSFDSISVWGQLLPNGKVQVAFEMIALRYSLAWSNPLWDNLQMDVQTERPQILRSLRMTLLDLPQPSPGRQQNKRSSLRWHCHGLWSVLAFESACARCFLAQLHGFSKKPHGGWGQSMNGAFLFAFWGYHGSSLWCFFCIDGKRVVVDSAIWLFWMVSPLLQERRLRFLRQRSWVALVKFQVFRMRRNHRPKTAGSSGSFQVVDTIEVSDDDASTNSSAYSLLLAVGPGGG